MSSFFDDASALVNKFLKSGQKDKAKEVVQAAKDRLLNYWKYNRNFVYRVNLKKYDEFVANCLALLDKHNIIDGFEIGYSDVIELLHDVAHEMGSRDFKLRNLGRMMDNPYFVKNFSVLSKEKRFE